MSVYGNTKDTKVAKCIKITETKYDIQMRSRTCKHTDKLYQLNGCPTDVTVCDEIVSFKDVITT